VLLLEALRDGKPSVRLALTPPCAPPCYDEVYDGSCLEEAEGAETATLTLALTLTPSPKPHPNPNPKPNPHPDSDPGPKPHPTPNRTPGSKTGVLGALLDAAQRRLGAATHVSYG